MKIVLDTMGWNQVKLGEILGMSQTAAGKIVRGPDAIPKGTALNKKHAIKIHAASGFEIEWLVLGTGNMKPQGNIVAEATTHYVSKGEEANQTQINKRYILAIDEFKFHRHILSDSDACEALKINYTHLNNVRNGKKDVTMTLLIQSVKNGNINANYVLIDRLPVLHGNAEDRAKEVVQLKRRIDELENDKRNQQLVIDTFTGNMKQTG